VPKEYIDQVIEQADIKRNHRISYDEFLNMWEFELDERKLENLSGINAKRTVADLADELLDFSTDDEDSNLADSHR